MTTPTLDRDRLRELFDLRSSFNELMGGDYRDDPYPIWHQLRERGPVLPGILHELTGCSRADVLARFAVSGSPALLHVRLRDGLYGLSRRRSIRVVAGTGRLRQGR